MNDFTVIPWPARKITLRADVTYTFADGRVEKQKICAVDHQELREILDVMREIKARAFGPIVRTDQEVSDIDPERAEKKDGE